MLGKPDEEITQNMWSNAWEIQSSLAHKFGETSVGKPDVFFLSLPNRSLNKLALC